MPEENPNPQNLKKIDGKIILEELEVERNPETGLNIKIKCPLNLKFLSTEEHIGGFKFARVDCSYPKKETLQGIPGRFYTDTVLEYDNEPNLSFFLAKNLKEGVTFNFGLFPISDEKLLNWIKKFKIQTKIIYLTYCKPFKVRVRFSSETIESEIHD